MRRIVSRQVRKLRARRAAGVETRVAGAEHRDAPVGLPSTGGRGRTQRRPGTRLLYLRRARQLHFETLEPRLAPDALLAGTALVASVLAGG